MKKKCLRELEIGEDDCAARTKEEEDKEDIKGNSELQERQDRERRTEEERSPKIRGKERKEVKKRCQEELAENIKERRSPRKRKNRMTS